jgi:endoglucanase
VPVVLRLWVRAVIPAGFQDMTPFTSHDTPAHRALLHFARGVNFGNNLELTNYQARMPYSITDFVQARSEGFDHIRLPVGWQLYAGPAPGYLLSNDIFAQVDQLVSDALSQGLSIILDVHNFTEFTQDPASYTNELYALWGQIAAHYSNAPPTVAFEVFNEPRDKATTPLMNQVYATTVQQIRVTNPQRTILLGPSAFDGIDELNYLILPDWDQNIIATVHTYDPFFFTHQGEPFAGVDAQTTPIEFPGPPLVPVIPAPGMSQYATNWVNDYNTLPTDQNPSSPIAFLGHFAMLRQWSDYYGRPIYVGEFGCSANIAPTSRIHYYTAKRQALDQYGLAWAIWDWKAGFHYSLNGAPDPSGLRDALFPGPELQAQSNGSLLLSAALGKACVVQRAPSLQPPVTWQGVVTQLLTGPTFQLTTSPTNQKPAGFYRAYWVK